MLLQTTDLNSYFDFILDIYVGLKSILILF